MMSMRDRDLIDHLGKIFRREVTGISPLPFEDANSLTGKTSMGVSPISKYRLYFEDGEERDIIVKLKSSKVILNGIRLLNFSKKLSLYYYLARYHKILSFDHSFLREIKYYNNISEELKPVLPLVYGSHHSRAKDSYIIAMKEFTGNQPLTKDVIYSVLDHILLFHISFYGKGEVVKRFHLNYYSLSDYKKSRPLLRALFQVLKEENRVYFGEDEAYLLEFIDGIHLERSKLKEHFTLTHNDFGPRNMAFDGENIIFYDWELSAYQNPEHDLIEYLCFVLHDFSYEDLGYIISYYKNRLFQGIGLSMAEGDYDRILLFNISEFIVNKLSVYRTAGKTFQLDFIENLCKNAAKLLRYLRVRVEAGK